MAADASTMPEPSRIRPPAVAPDRVRLPLPLALCLRLLFCASAWMRSRFRKCRARFVSSWWIRVMIQISPSANSSSSDPTRGSRLKCDGIDAGTRTARPTSWRIYAFIRH
jgi:hypothetical protein